MDGLQTLTKIVALREEVGFVCMLRVCMRVYAHMSMSLYMCVRVYVNKIVVLREEVGFVCMLRVSMFLLMCLFLCTFVFVCM